MEKIKNAECTEATNAPEIQWDQLRKLMEFQELTYPALARMSGTPESTLRKLLQGVTKDPRVSTMYPIVKALGASFDRLLGLAPKRDFEREEATYDVTLMDSMRHQVQEMAKEREADVNRNAEKIAENASMIEALNAKVNEQMERLEFKAGRIHDLEMENQVLKANVDARDRTISNLESMYKKRDATVGSLRKDLTIMRYVLIALAFICVGICGYFIWEILNLDKGITGRLYEELLK